MNKILISHLICTTGPRDDVVVVVESGDFVVTDLIWVVVESGDFVVDVESGKAVVNVVKYIVVKVD